MRSAFGRLFFVLLWPAMWLVFPLTRRVRVVIVQGDKVLLVKHFIGPGVWDVPGGGIKFGEEVISAAKREIHEELGLSLSDIDVLGTDVTIWRQFGLLLRLHYVVAKLDPAKQLVRPNWEIIDSDWFMQDELKNIVPKSVFTALKSK